MVKEQEPNIEQSKLDLADRLCGLGLLSASASELFFKQATHIMNLNGCDYKREFKKVYKEFLLYAIGRNLNKYHRFLHGEIQKFEGKTGQTAA